MHIFNFIHSTGHLLVYTLLAVYLILASTLLPVLLWMLKRQLDLLVALQESSVTLQYHSHNTLKQLASEVETSIKAPHNNTAIHPSHTGQYTKKNFTVVEYDSGNTHV